MGENTKRQPFSFQSNAILSGNNPSLDFNQEVYPQGSSYIPPYQVPSPAARQAFQDSLTSYMQQVGVVNFIRSSQQIEYQRRMEALYHQELLIRQLLQILYPTVSSKVVEPMTNSHRLLAISHAQQALQIESLQTQVKEMQKFYYPLVTSARYIPPTNHIPTTIVENLEKGDSDPSSSSDNQAIFDLNAKLTKIQEQSSRGFTLVQEAITSIKQDIAVKKREIEMKESTLDTLLKSFDSHLTTLATNNTISNLVSKEVSKMKTQMETIAALVASLGDPNETKGENGTKRINDSPSSGNEPKRQRKDKEIIIPSSEADFDEGDQVDDETKKLDVPSRVGAAKPLVPIPMKLEHSTNLQDHTNRDASITSWSAYEKKKERFIARHKSKNNVWSEVDIAEVTKCRIGTFEKSFDYTEVSITRKDGSKWIVNDADYPDMHPCDWMQIADLLFHTKATRAEIAVYGRLKAMLVEYMKPWKSEDIEVARMYDFPIDECFRPSVPPFGLDKVPGGSLVSDPEPGLVYDVLAAKGKVKKHFFRFSEVAKYSNEKLDTFLTILTGSMSPCEFIRKQGIEKINHWKEVRETFQRMKKTIEYHWQTR